MYVQTSNIGLYCKRAYVQTVECIVYADYQGEVCAYIKAKSARISCVCRLSRLISRRSLL